MKASHLLAAALLAASSPPAASAQEAPLYKIVKTILLGAPDRWDYVVFDPDSHRVYVAHATEVTVVDGTTGAIVGQIGDFPGGTHGIAIVPKSGVGYTDDGKGGLAASFDLKTLQVTKRIPAKPDADGVVYDPASGHVFVIDGDSGTLTVIDPATNDAIGTIDMGGGLEFGVADGKGKLYVNGAEKNELIRVETKTNTVDAHWPLPGCTSPHGIAIDPDTRRVFVSCANKTLVVVDGVTGKIVATFPIGGFTDFAVFDPVRKRAISINGEGNLSVFEEKDANTIVPLATVPTQPSARTAAIDPATGRLYVAAIEITKFEPATTPGGRPHIEVAPGSLKLLILDSVK